MATGNIMWCWHTCTYIHTYIRVTHSSCSIMRTWINGWSWNTVCDLMHNLMGIFFIRYTVPQWASLHLNFDIHQNLISLGITIIVYSTDIESKTASVRSTTVNSHITHMYIPFQSFLSRAVSQIENHQVWISSLICHQEWGGHCMTEAFHWLEISGCTCEGAQVEGVPHFPPRQRLS
jgi:hypothetical protein